MKYKDVLIQSLHSDEFQLISEAEVLKFCGQSHMYDFVDNFDFCIMEDHTRYSSGDPFRLTLQYDLLSFVGQLDDDKKDLLEIINSTESYDIIGIDVQILHLKDLLNCVASIIKNNQIEPNDLFAGFCMYYDYPEILASTKEEAKENKKV